MFVDRRKPDPRKEVSFLRAFVSHYSFVTGLQGAMEGKSGGPEDCSVGVNVILNATIFEGAKVVDPAMFSPLEEAPYHNVLEGFLFQCCDLLSFIAGTYDSKELKEHAADRREGPSEFTIETWVSNDDGEWQLKRKTHWSGVKWLDYAHTGDGGDRTCAGIATFVCDKKETELIEDGEAIKSNSDKKLSYFDLRRRLQEGIAGPKHPSNYLG